MAIVGVRDHHGQEEYALALVLDQVVLVHATQKELEVPARLTLRILQVYRVGGVEALQALAVLDAKLANILNYALTIQRKQLE